MLSITKYDFLGSLTCNYSTEGAAQCGMKLAFESPAQCPCCCATVCRWVMIPVMPGFTNKKTKPKETKQEEEENLVGAFPHPEEISFCRFLKLDQFSNLLCSAAL